MSDFFKITTVSFFDSEFAYCESSDDAKYSSDTYPKCPVCGEAIGSLYWIEPRKVMLSKPKYGDFVSGNVFLVSEKFKNAYEKTTLKGIKEFIPVEVVKIKRMRKDSPPPPLYYTIELEYSYARVDRKKSIIKGQRDRRYCSLCMPFRSTKDKINGIYIDDTDWDGEDIFHLHEMGNSVYASQKFIDFCLKNEFTNFKYVNTKKYVFT